MTLLSIEGDLVNYDSWIDNETLALEELQRECEDGFLDGEADINTLEATVGKLHPSRVACLVKQKDGSTKARLIHDLRRSGINRLIGLE